MILILSQIPFKELIVKKDIKAYATDCNYFSMEVKRTKSDIAVQARFWIDWYCSFETTPLYIAVVSDKYWSMVGGNLRDRRKFSTWKTVPRYIEDALKENSLYHTIKIQDRICLDEDIKNIFERIIHHNFKKDPVFTTRIGGTVNEKF